MAIHANRHKIIKAIRSNEEFSIATMRGKAGYGVGGGTMPRREVYYEAVDAAKALGKAVYTVLSYATPIGWHVEGEGWTIPDVKYSVTTSAHQGIMREAAN